MTRRTLTLALALVTSGTASYAQDVTPYPESGDIAPPLTRSASYDAIPQAARGPAIDPQKGYRVEDLGESAFMVTEGVYQVLFIQTDDGLILVDAPPNIGARLLDAAAEIAPDEPITHLLYSHAHVDHVGFAGEIAAEYPNMRILAHAETAEILNRAGDPARPLPDLTFEGTEQPYILEAGGQTLTLTYSGPNHQPGNIEIWHEASETLMLVDVVFPGWMMWRRLALAQDIPGTFELVAGLNERYDYETLIAGHVDRAGTPADVDLQFAFMTDLHEAAASALATTVPGEGLDDETLANPWAVFDHYIDRVALTCVETLTPAWRDRIAAFDVFIHDQCLAMEQSLRIDGASLPRGE